MSTRILITDDEPDMRWVLARIFGERGYEVVEAADGREALAAAQEQRIDVVLSDVRMPDLDGIELLAELARRDRDLPVVLLTALEDVQTAVGAMKQGAFDYLQKPFDQQRLLATVERAVEQRRLRAEVARLRGALQRQEVTFGVSPQALALERTIALVADQATLSVLIVGESGTGKEVAAREIHRRSGRSEGPFVAVDCGALPEPLMESQLFGHRRGAFTGADRDRPGLFRMAHGGTLFLDELGNLAPPLQAKLLRALQERAVAPVGSSEPVPFDARLLCATNSDLREAVRTQAFRMDLYHRVAEFTLHIPALRERTGDVAPFAERFLAEANAEMGRQIGGISAAALEHLRAQPWPGNLRELRNAVRRAVVTCTAAELEPGDLALHDGPPSVAPAGDPELGASLTERVRASSEAFEASILKQTLERVAGNKAAAARALGIDYTTLHRKLKRHGLTTMADPP
jgi:DNA-binding NtrC family response regulator